MLIPLVHGEPIRFGADREHGVVMGSDGQLRIVEVADVGEDALLVHDETEPGPGLQLSPAVERPPRADADRRVPGRRPARLRHRGQPPAGRGRTSATAPATSPRCCAPAPPGRSTELGPVGPGALRGLGPRYSSSRRNTTPVRGLGEKNVVFGGMRSPPWAMSTIWATVAGRSSTPACGLDRARRRDDVVDAVLERDSWAGRPARACVEAGRVEVARRRLAHRVGREEPTVPSG